MLGLAAAVAELVSRGRRFLGEGGLRPVFIVARRSANDVEHRKRFGAPVRQWDHSALEAYGRGNMYLINSGTLVAADPSGSPDRWSQGTNAGSAPVADPSDVFVGEADYVVAYSGAGCQVWSAVASSGSSVSGLALGNGQLVATGSAVTAFGN